MRWTRILILVAVLAVIFGGVFAFIQYKNMMIGKFMASRAHPVIAVTAERVTTETWQGAVPAVGTLRAVNGVGVTPEVSGVVKSIDFKSGDTVKKGDTLVQLDADIETANRNSALAQLKLLQDQLERTTKLPVGTAVTEQALNQTRFQAQAQQATVIPSTPRSRRKPSPRLSRDGSASAKSTSASSCKPAPRLPRFRTFPPSRSASASARSSFPC